MWTKSQEVLSARPGGERAAGRTAAGPRRRGRCFAAATLLNGRPNLRQAPCGSVRLRDFRALHPPAAGSSAGRRRQRHGRPAASSRRCATGTRTEPGASRCSSEEPRRAYDRVALSSYFDGATPTTSTSSPTGCYDADGYALHLDEAVDVDRPRPRGRSPPATAGRSATTRWCWRPARTRSCRRCPATTCPAASSTARSTTSTRSAAAPRAPRDDPGPPRRAGRRRRPARAGGGQRRCGSSGMSPHVVEFAPRLMPLQVDEGGGGAAAPADRGARRHRAHSARRSRRSSRTGGRMLRRRSPTAPSSTLDVVVFAAGIRPRDELARDAGPARSASAAASSSTTPAAPPTRTSTRSASAPASTGRCYGLVAPGLRDGRGRRRPAARRRRRPSPAPTRRPSSSCWASTSPASATRSPTTAGALEVVAQRPGRADATRSSSCPTTRRRCSAACSSATPPRTRTLRPLVGAAAARRPGRADRSPAAAARRRRRRAARRRAGLLVQQRHQGRDLRRRSPTTG